MTQNIEPVKASVPESQPMRNARPGDEVFDRDMQRDQREPGQDAEVERGEGEGIEETARAGKQDEACAGDGHCP
jgi:hypothetical protein